MRFFWKSLVSTLFQELFGTDRIARLFVARLFDMFPVGKLSELATTSKSAR
jgi:hypothetical protein